jgi:peptidyl-prolyl cis-trans isomerase D
LANLVAAHEMEKRTVKLSSFPVRPESITTPDDATIDSFFQENKPSYDAPQLRSAKIGSLSAAIIAEEITISDSEIRAAFDDRLDEFSTPETRSIRQMVFDDAATANAALDRLNNGEGFAAVAASMLDWTDADTNLGTVTETSLDGALVGSAFAAEAGAVVGPVQTAFGFHLLSIDTITAGGVTQLDDVREQIIRTLRGEQAINLLYDRVNMLEDALGSGATIEEAINKAGGRLDIATDIDRQGQTIDGMPAAGQVGELLQDSAILELIWDSELNEASVIQEGSDDMFFVVTVSTETEPRERRLDEVRAQVISDYKRVEAVKSARAAAEAVAAIADGDQDTAPSPAFRRNGIGLDHEAAGLIARAAFEQNSGDIQVIETGREAIAVRTLDIIPATDEELKDTRELVLTVMNNALRDDLTNLLLVSLSKKHDLQLNLPAVRQILVGNAQ